MKNTLILKFRDGEWVAWPRTLGLLVLFVAVFASRLLASPIIVVPTGLAAGSQYRLIFVTDGMYLATSSNIATYNSEVNTVGMGQREGPFDEDSDPVGSRNGSTEMRL